MTRIPRAPISTALAMALASALAAQGAAAPSLRETAHVGDRLGRGRFVLSNTGEGLVVPSHDAAGWTQRARILPDGRTDVTIIVLPRLIRPAAPYPRPTSPDDAKSAYLGDPAGLPPAIRDVAEWLVHAQHDQVGASGAIIQWVSLNVEHRDVPPHDDSALATLESGIGSCVGRSKLAVALLQAAGLPARTVHGLLVVPRSGRGPTGFTLHRFVEAWIDGLGWVPSDPGESVHVVDPSHVIVALDDAPYDPDSQHDLTVAIAEPVEWMRPSPRRARPLLTRSWAPQPGPPQGGP